MDDSSVPAYSAQQIRAAERPHLDAHEPLMARAAGGLAAVIEQSLAESGVGESGGRVLVLAGSGDNGGDALYAAASAAAAGATVEIVACGSRVHGAAHAAALAAGAHDLVEADERDATAHQLRLIASAAGRSSVIVDGIVGTGTASHPALRSRARGIVVAIVGAIDAVTPRPVVIGVDLPSGIHPDTGDVPDPAVLPADVTVTFGGMKAGLVRGAGATLCGGIVLVDIGLTEDLASMPPVLRTQRRIRHLSAEVDPPEAGGHPTCA